MKRILIVMILMCIDIVHGNSQQLTKQDSLWLDNARIELQCLIDMKNEAISECNGESLQQPNEGKLTDYDRLSPEEKERHNRELAKLRKKADKEAARENSKGFFRGAWRVIKAIFGA